jgi:hypothetical protein
MWCFICVIWIWFRNYISGSSMLCTDLKSKTANHEFGVPAHLWSKLLVHPIYSILTFNLVFRWFMGGFITKQVWLVLGVAVIMYYSITSTYVPTFSLAICSLKYARKKKICVNISIFPFVGNIRNFRYVFHFGIKYILFR